MIIMKLGAVVTRKQFAQHIAKGAGLGLVGMVATGTAKRSVGVVVKVLENNSLWDLVEKSEYSMARAAKG